MVTQKDRRRSGYCTPSATISKKGIVENDLFINQFYNDWNNYRDGMRNWFGDFKKIKDRHSGYKKFNPDLYKKRIDMNEKQKRLLKIRKSMKDIFNKCKYDL